MQLREYQTEGIDRLRHVLQNGYKKPIMVLPTGGGKSHIFGRVISNVVGNGKSVLWIVHRRNLVIQMKDILEQHFNITPAIIMSGHPTDTSNPVQLCTIQTYSRRLKLDELECNRFYIPADVVLIDEAHRTVSKTYMEILDLYKDKIIMGCTATPMRADQRGMGEAYDSIVDIVGVEELTSRGYLSPARYFVPASIDLDGVKVAMGDYVVKDLDKKINKPKLIGDVVENWLKHGENRPTIVFCCNVKHSIAVKGAFQRAGVNAEHLDARSSDTDRDEVFASMERGDTTVVCNVALYQEGLDIPEVSCIVMARPTKSLGLYRQCCGRGLRISDGKEDCLIFDHGNVIEEHGFLTDEITWSLDGKEKAWAKKKKPKEKLPVQCRVCNMVFEGSNICPDCGSPVKTFGKKIETLDAELEELKGKKKFSAADKRRWYGMFLYEQARLKKTDKWVLAQYKNKFDVWPRKMETVMPIEPDKEAKNWLTYQRIKWAKSKRKAAA